MTSGQELLEALRAAAEDPPALRTAIRRCGKAMAETGVSRIGLADALLALARHPDAGLRKEVAEASHLFPDAFFDAAYAILKCDLASASPSRRSRATATGTVRASIRGSSPTSVAR